MPKPSRLQRIAVLLIVVVAGFQMYSVTTAAMPTNSASTSLKPVTSYLSPFFNQNWRLFAPNPISDDREIWFRGEYVDKGGATRTTQWFDWSDVEVQVIHDNLIGGRAGYITNKMIGSLNSAYFALTTDQRTIANGDKATALKGYVALHDSLITKGDNPGAVNQFLRYEESLVELGTGVLEAVHPGVRFNAVAYRIVVQSVVPYAQRKLPDEELKRARPSPDIRESGWRKPIRGSANERSTIADFLRRHR